MTLIQLGSTHLGAPQSPADQLRTSFRTKVDAVIVGSGAGGAAAARTLTRKGLKVLVLEEGKRLTHQQFTGRDAPWSLANLYRDGGLQTFKGSVIAPLPAGRVVGGSTVVNSAICFRAPEDRLATWSKQSGVPWFNAQTFTPLFDDVEKTIGVTETTPEIARANNLIFLRGAKALGLECGFIRRNAPGCQGCGVCHLGCPSGSKWSVDRNFLLEAENDGASVLPQCRVAGLRMEGKRCVGVNVELLDDANKVAATGVVEASHVILAAGSIGTPLILLRNTVGNASGHVGKHMAMHPGVSSLAMFDEEVKPWSGVPQGAWAHMPDEPASLMETFSVTLDIYYRFIATAGVAGLENIKQANHLASSGAMLRDQSVGTVSLGDGWRANIQYTLDDEDRRTGIRSMRWLTKLQFAAGARTVQSGRKGVPFLASEKEALATLTDDLPETQFQQLYGSHPQGTCRISANPADGVVDPTGRVHGTDNLFIMDGSLFPSALGVNPQMTIMAMAMHLASGITT